MTFRVGMKVVCIDFDDVGASEGCGCFDLTDPQLNDVATISGFAHDDDGVLCLLLKEFPAPECPHCCAGWTSLEWRPVAERKTSIEIFTKMLTPQGVDA